MNFKKMFLYFGFLNLRIHGSKSQLLIMEMGFYRLSTYPHNKNKNKKLTILLFFCPNNLIFRISSSSFFQEFHLLN
jgi:hypothetical protein